MDKLTILDFASAKTDARKLAWVTAYDYPSARFAEAAEVDAILVGDSLGMAVLGYDSTIPVTMEDMVHHARAVRRGAPDVFMVVDLPFMSYHVSVEQALTNAGRVMQEAEADAVKLEGGKTILPQVRAIVEAGIPVVGHIGLTPQSVHQLGGFRAQGRDIEKARELLRDARDLESAGCCAIVLECVPRLLANYLTERVHVPTIGIGSGAGCDGQVLVYHGMMGFDTRYAGRITRQYADLGTAATNALRTYVQDVRAGDFPTQEHAFKMSPDVLRQLKEEDES